MVRNNMEERHHHTGKNIMSKNARIVYAWRVPVMHAVLLFCLVKQAQALDRRHIGSEVPGYILAYRSLRDAKTAFWETICDLRRKE